MRARVCVGWRAGLALVGLLIASTGTLRAQPASDAGKVEKAEKADKDVDVESEIPAFQNCPCKGDLGGLATIDVPEGYAFIGRAGVARFLELTHNVPGGRELGIVLTRSSVETDSGWFAIFEFDDIGYVKDDEKDALDADALLKTLQDGNASGNEERRRRGWDTIELRGWHRKPYYDTVTNNLTWGTRVSGAEPSSSIWINQSVRVLGRAGVMTADVVFDEKIAESATNEFATVLKGFEFNQGSRYAEFRSGDKIASYGLTALVAGGIGAAAVKSGLFSKFWKLIVVGAVALLGFLRKLFGSLFKKPETTASDVPPPLPPPTPGT